MVPKPKDIHEVAPPGELVEVGQTRLHLYDCGQGEPTVVVDCGMGDYTLGWSLVQPEVARFTRILTYDRAGYGWSDPGLKPRSCQRAVTELHGLLVASGIKGPYVLVGHSWGGLTVRLFAHQYPGEVAGMVLVDAGHEDQWKRLPAAAKKIQAANVNAWKVLSLLSKAGLLQAVGRWIGAPPIVNQLPAAVRPLYLAGYTGRYFDTLLDESAALETSLEQVRGTGGLGDMPLVVLTGGNFLDLSRVRLPSTFPMEAARQEWIRLQADLAGLSSNGQHMVAEECGHGIVTEKPELVINAIRRIVEAVKTKGAL